MEPLKIRSKFYLENIKTITTEHGSWKELEFNANYDPTIPEDMRFQVASPSGRITQRIDNPAALEFFKPGQRYYVDFIEVPPVQTAPANPPGEANAPDGATGTTTPSNASEPGASS